MNASMRTIVLVFDNWLRAGTAADHRTAQVGEGASRRAGSGLDGGSKATGAGRHIDAARGCIGDVEGGPVTKRFLIAFLALVTLA